MISRRLVLIGATTAIVAAAVGYWLLQGPEKPLYQTQTLEKGDIVSTISASGKLQAVGTVEVGSQVSGQISALNADFNSVVTKGEVMARIDPSTFEAKVLQAQSQLATARAQLAQAEAQLLESQRDYDTKKALKSSGFYSVRALQTAEADLLTKRASVTSARASVRQAEANLNQAKIDLNRTYIRAPVDGVVIDRAINLGQTVAASLQAPKLFVIAEDLAQMQVEASVDEADIGNVKAGQRVEFTVDAYPDKNFQGTVKEVRISGVENQNVITYTVIITAPNPERRLLPMMTANATIFLGEIMDVLKVPVAALQYQPRPAEAEKPAASATGGNPFAAPMGPPMRRSGLPRNSGGSNSGGGGGGGGGGMSPDAMIEQLTDALKLSRDQQAQVRAIVEQNAASRPSFNGAPTDAQRAEMRARRQAMREKINAVLTPEQQAIYADMAPLRAGPGQTGKPASVWILDPATGEPKQRQILIGASDDEWAAVVAGRLKAGDQVIVAETVPGEDVP